MWVCATAVIPGEMLTYAGAAVVVSEAGGAELAKSKVWQAGHGHTRRSGGYMYGHVL